jgi:hypothetical protein
VLTGTYNTVPSPSAREQRRASYDQPLSLIIGCR